MKIILQDNNYFIVRFDKGEELFSALSHFLNEQNISASHLSAIGTCSQVELGYYNKNTKQYEKHTVGEDLEVLNLAGNSGTMNDKPAIHLHGSFSKRDLSVIGGHVLNMTVAATCEVNVVKLTGGIERKNNPDSGLNLLT